MKKALRKEPVLDLEQPENIVAVRIDSKTGLLASPKTKKTITEKSEDDNIKSVGDLNSNNPIIDVAAEVLSVWALPLGVFVVTSSLLGVVYLVGRARRSEALGRVAEQSILIGENNE